MRPDQSELRGLSAEVTPPADRQVRAVLAPEHERQLPQPVRLISRTGKGKVRVQGELGVRDFWAVFPWRLRDIAAQRQRVPTAVIRALPWTGAGPDPGVPAGWDEIGDQPGLPGLTAERAAGPVTRAESGPSAAPVPHGSEKTRGPR